MDDHAYLQAQESVKASHPFGIAFRQVIVDRDYVYALARQRVEVAGQGGDQRLAFAGLHFGDPAFVQHHAAHQLDVEMAHIQDAPAGLANYRESFHQQVVERRALRTSLFKFDGFLGQFGIRQRTYCRFQRANCRHRRQHFFDFAFVLCSEYFGEDFIDNHEWSQYGRQSAKSILPCL